MLYPQVGVNSGLDGRGGTVHHVTEHHRAGGEVEDTDCMSHMGAVGLNMQPEIDIELESAGGCMVASMNIVPESKKIVECS